MGVQKGRHQKNNKKKYFSKCCSCINSNFKSSENILQKVSTTRLLPNADVRALLLLRAISENYTKAAAKYMAVLFSRKAKHQFNVEKAKFSDFDYIDYLQTLIEEEAPYIDDEFTPFEKFVEEEDAVVKRVDTRLVDKHVYFGRKVLSKNIGYADTLYTKTSGIKTAQLFKARVL